MAKIFIVSCSFVAVLVLLILRQEGVIHVPDGAMATAIGIAVAIGAVFGVAGVAGRSVRVERLEHDCLTQPDGCEHLK